MVALRRLFWMFSGGSDDETKRPRGVLPARSKKTNIRSPARQAVLEAFALRGLHPAMQDPRFVLLSVAPSTYAVACPLAGWVTLATCDVSNGCRLPILLTALSSRPFFCLLDPFPSLDPCAFLPPEQRKGDLYAPGSSRLACQIKVSKELDGMTVFLPDGPPVG